MRVLISTVTLLLVSACATPYRPPVLVNGSKSFEGIGGLLEKSQAVDVVIVHGMCTYTEKDAQEDMAEIISFLDTNLVKPAAPEPRIGSVRAPRVEVVKRTETVAGSTVRFSALIWSGMTTPLKDQLIYDQTGAPNDCTTAAPGTCKPLRAKYNGMFKDGLLNDCLADALVYQGNSKVPIRDAMVTALTDVLMERDSAEPLVVVSESLGSKIVFDALSEMLVRKDARNLDAVRQLRQRLAIVFMEANQLPILSLADQDIRGPKQPGPLQPLQELARVRPPGFDMLKLVAFTDPNDLLSYRLLGSRFDGLADIEISDVVVSNASSYFGLFEDPLAAHRGYATNRDVTGMIACGAPLKSRRCK